MSVREWRGGRGKGGEGASMADLSQQGKNANYRPCFTEQLKQESKSDRSSCITAMLGMRALASYSMTTPEVHMAHCS